jgi:hypothetical protein
MISVNKDYENPDLLNKARYLFRSKRFDPVLVNYENLKFSGDLKLFDDLDFRNSITKAYHSFQKIERVESIDHAGVNVYFQDYFLPNAKFMEMSNSSPEFGRDNYFENMVLSRETTLRQNRNAYSNSIDLLNNLKATLIDSK